MEIMYLNLKVILPSIIKEIAMFKFFKSKNKQNKIEKTPVVHKNTELNEGAEKIFLDKYATNKSSQLTNNLKYPYIPISKKTMEQYVIDFQYLKNMQQLVKDYHENHFYIESLKAQNKLHPYQIFTHSFTIKFIALVEQEIIELSQKLNITLDN